MGNKQRILWVDMAKGWCLLAVIVSHFDTGVLSAWCNTFDLPMFLFVSGYLLNTKQDFLPFFKRKSRGILLPYLFLGGLVVLFRFLYSYYYGALTFEDVPKLLALFVLQRRFYTIWYLTCLFCLNIVFFLLAKWLKKPWVLFLLSCVLAVGGLTYYHFGGISLPWNLDMVPTAMPFFALGYWYKHNQEKVDVHFQSLKIRLPLFLGLAAVSTACVLLSLHFTGGFLAFYIADYGQPVLTYIGAFAGIGAVLLFSRFFTAKPILYLGENSLLYFAWHYTICMPLLESLLGAAFHVGRDYTSLPLKVLEFVLVMAMLTGLNFLLTRPKLRKLIGK